MACTGDLTCTCGCCGGIGIATPVARDNPPGLAEVAYRVGTWGTFRESMVARLSSADYPALAFLKTRDADDFSIALLDASAVVFDILTFYQERLANESYLRTATQRRALTELARLIGYQPTPGVAALAVLAFTVKAATGAPANPATTALTIPAGTQVQSVPAQGQAPQTFETSAAVLAKPDWNAMPVTAAVPWTPPGDASLWLQGTATQLHPGDSLLILGTAREHWTPGSTPDEQWDVVTLNDVFVDTPNGRTRVAWDRRLMHATGGGTSPAASAWTTATVFAFRQKAALFGHNAPSPYLFTAARNKTKTALPALIDDGGSQWVWRNYGVASSAAIDLDAPYSKVVVGSWFALVHDGTAQLYRATSAQAVSRADFAVSARVTRVAGDFADPDIGTTFPLQGTAVLAQAEPLAVAEQPLDTALFGSIVEIAALRPDLAGIGAIAITGKPQKLELKPTTKPPTFVPDDGSASVVLKPGDRITLIDPRPLAIQTDGGIASWKSVIASTPLRAADAAGRTGTVAAVLARFALAASTKDDPDVQEFARVSSVEAVATPVPHTRIRLATPLAHGYDRTTTTVNANVGLATAGRTVGEVLGSGSAATPNQRFVLRQSPLTYVQSPTESGRLSTLVVRADGIAWTEVPTLYGQPRSARVFATRGRPDGTTSVVVGDNVEGATLPTGQNNVVARYRVGSGVAGNVGTGAITTLVDRPLGVSAVTNPAPATGGQDPQSADDIRANAPLGVLTLGRAVSIVDYRDYAASYAGIAKATASWIPSGAFRGVFMTVAAADGSALPPGNATLASLVASLRDHGNPLIPIVAASFLETLFRVSANIAYDPRYDAAVVEAGIVATLRDRYRFATRTFGEGVSADAIEALIQRVPGVQGVHVTALTLGPTSSAGDLARGGWSVASYHAWLAAKVSLPRPSAGPMRICAAAARSGPATAPRPAEILVLDPDPHAIVLGVLP